MNSKLYPHNIGIELVRGCNFKCRMCPVTFHNNGSMEFMEINTLRLILDKLKEEKIKPNVLWFFNFGEPMAHPKFIELMDLTHKSGVFKDSYVVMHTNASYLNGEKAEAILNIPLIKKIVFSFDGFGDKESYSLLRGNHYDLVLKNINEFSEKARLRRPELILETATIIPRQDEVPDMNVVPIEEATNNLKKIFKPMAVNVVTRYLHEYSGEDELGISSLKRRVMGGCVFLEEYTLIFTNDGQVLPCCSVYDKRYSIGSIFQNSPTELINSVQLERIRHNIRIDRRDNIPMCKSCTLSMGGESKEYALDIWNKKLLNGEVTNISEAYYLGGLILSTKVEQQNDKAKDYFNNKLESSQKMLIDRINHNNSALELTLLEQNQLIEDKIKQTKRELIERNSVLELKLFEQEQFFIENLRILEKQYYDKLDKINCEHLTLLSILEKRIEESNLEKKYLNALLFELFRKEEKRSIIGQMCNIFKKEHNIYYELNEKESNFIDGLILGCSEFKKGSILSFSHIIPHDSYFEYKVKGYGDVIKVFLTSGKGEKLIVEVVKYGHIVKNELLEIENIGMQSIYVGDIKGECYIRFRSLNNESIIRVLEIKNRKLFISQRRYIASFIE
jgi:radical SAM protein with 4Fe4S-binding SPASM domain